MKRIFVCGNGHSFKLCDEGDLRGVSLTQNVESEISLGVPCPLCGSLTEVHWPLDRDFQVAALKAHD